MNFTAYASSSQGNLYTLSDGQTNLLIECGVTYREMQRLLPMPPSEYDYCFVSHKHGDHYNSNAAYELLRRGVLTDFGEHVSGALIDSISVDSFPVPHDITNYGFMFRSRRDGETCVFMIDCFYSPVRFDFSPTLFCIEANYSKDLMKPGDSLNDRLFTSHMELQQCIATIKANDLSKTREIHLLHLSDDRSDESRFIDAVQQATGIPVFAAPKWAGRK